MLHRGIFVALAVHATSILLLLWQDASQRTQPAAVPLLASTELQFWTRDVVLMHHKRLRELNATLWSLSRMQEERHQLRVTVVQTLDSYDAAAASHTAALLDQLRPQLRFRNLTHQHHLIGSHDGGDASYSTDALQYGTKRNSCRNLVNALDAAFSSRSKQRAVLVVEDDAILASDALQFFDAAASMSAAAASGEEVAASLSSASLADKKRRLGDVYAEPRSVVAATAFCYPRDDHDDYAATRQLPGRFFLAPQPHHLRRSRLRSITFRTLAWMATREVYEAMRHDFVSGENPILSLAAGAPLHRSLEGCSYCENLCYDHWLEWRFRNSSLICPAVPRSASSFRGGMTEHRGALQADGVEGLHARRRAAAGELNTQWVSSGEFVDDVHRRAAARSLRRLMLWLVPASLLALSCSAWPHIRWRCRRAGGWIRPVGKANK